MNVPRQRSTVPPPTDLHEGECYWERMYVRALAVNREMQRDLIRLKSELARASKAAPEPSPPRRRGRPPAEIAVVDPDDEAPPPRRGPDEEDVADLVDMMNGRD